MEKPHVIIFSHGFGVRKDGRGLFTDIARALNNTESVLFDYNEFNEEQNTLTVRPLSQQAVILKRVLEETVQSNPEATIDLVCHSQGCIVAGLAKPEGIRKIVLLAPPFDISTDRTVKTFGSRPGAEINLDGVSKFPRRDGSVTLVPKEYWADRQGIKPTDLYNQLATLAELTVIKATRDEVLGEEDSSKLNPKVHVIEIDSNHDFTGEARGKLLSVLVRRLVQ